MIIGITGTPGTGKTTVANELGSKFGFEVISISQVVQEKEIYDDYNEKRGTHLMDIDKLKQELQPMLEGDVILDGHLAHYFPDLDYVFVLRTNPKNLKSRLKSKEYKDEKVVENVQAEILDVILQETVELHGKNIFEFDTTEKTVSEIVKEQKAILDQNKEVMSLHRPGKIDWTGYSSFL